MMRPTKDAVVLPERGPLSEGGAAGLLAQIPAEAVVEVFATFCHVVRTSADMQGANAAFGRELALLEKEDVTAQQRLDFLRALLLDGSHSEEAKLKLVDAICTVATK